MARIAVGGLKEDSGNVFEVVPAGEYDMQIADVEETETGENSKNPGQPMLKIKHQIIGSEHEGRTLFSYLVLPPENPQTEDERRNRAKLKSLLISCGINPEDDSFDTQDLIGCQHRAVVSVGKNKNTGEASNNINRYLAV